MRGRGGRRGLYPSLAYLPCWRREFAYRAHRTSGGVRWSFHRDFGKVRLIMMDSRGGRVLEEGRRSMVDAEEWTWIEDHVATLELDGRRATITFERAVLDDSGEPGLRKIYERRLA